MLFGREDGAKKHIIGSITNRVRSKLLLLPLLGDLGLVLGYLAVGLAVVGRHVRRLHLHRLREFCIIVGLPLMEESLEMGLARLRFWS